MVVLFLYNQLLHRSNKKKWMIETLKNGSMLLKVQLASTYDVVGENRATGYSEKSAVPETEPVRVEQRAVAAVSPVVGLTLYVQDNGTQDAGHCSHM